MESLVKRMWYIIILLLLVVAAGAGGSVGGYLYGKDEGEDMTRKELEAKFDKEEKELKAEYKADESELKDFYNERIDDLEAEVARLRKEVESAK